MALNRRVRSDQTSSAGQKSQTMCGLVPMRAARTPARKSRSERTAQTKPAAPSNSKGETWPMKIAARLGEKKEAATAAGGSHHAGRS